MLVVLTCAGLGVWARAAGVWDARCPATEQAGEGAESSTPPANGETWNRQRNFMADVYARAWQSGRLISILDYPAWAVPLEPTWAEDPYDDLSWLRTYHSLGWLQAASRAYTMTGDPAFADDVRRYVLSWIRSNAPDDPRSTRAWYDGSVALRTDALVGMLPVLRTAMDTSELEELFDALALHGATLAGYLDDPRWTAHNHNLFHALSLHNLATAVPELERADEWRERARARMNELLTEMLDADGVSTEQAAAYHYTALRLFLEADEYLKAHGDRLGDAERALLARGSRFAALLPTPGGVLPAIGDTEYGEPAPWGLMAGMDRSGLGTPEAAYVLTCGREGERPPDLSFFPASGLAIVRPSYGEDGEWRDDLQVVVDMGPDRRPHGHYDTLNVVVSARGEQLLIDGGGPYQYGVAERRELIEAQSHNTVIVDGGGYEPGTVTVETVVDNPMVASVEAWHEKSRGVRHERTVLVLKPDVILIVDRLRATDGNRHNFDLRYHLDPDAQASEQSGGQIIRVRGAGMGIKVVASTGRLVDGDPTTTGWVTPRHGVRVQAPVLSYQQAGRAAWFVTAITPATAADAAVPSLVAGSNGETIAVQVSTGDVSWNVAVSSGRTPTVEADR
jgi:hypothetical protein